MVKVKFLLVALLFTGMASTVAAGSGIRDTESDLDSESYINYAVEPQDKVTTKKLYRSPVDFAITLAGNVGELRSDHFHAGIDIKALKGIGSSVMAARDGYISRVGVSPTGYGNVLYVTHSDGDVTVYAHLDRFVGPVARWIEKQQYAKKSYAVNLYPTPAQFPVKSGQQIATLGNSGSSGGPHLHFEIRRNGQPSNIIADGTYTVPDHVAPTIRRVLLFEVDTVQGVPSHRLAASRAVAQAEDGMLRMADTAAFTLSKPGYFAYEFIDYKDGKSNTMGVHSLDQQIDGEQNFSFTIDAIDFATTRYVNTMTSYGENRDSRLSVVRAYVSPNNLLKFYNGVHSRGVIAPPQWDQPLRVETSVCDDAGNRSEICFTVRRAARDSVARNGGVAELVPIVWNRETKHEQPTFRVEIPSGALYESTPMNIMADSLRPGVVTVGDGTIPLQKSIKVTLYSDTLTAALRPKALLVSVANDGKRSSVSGEWNDAAGGVTASVRRAGSFAIGTDTSAPKITPALKSGAALPAGRTLRFTVIDDLSGIGHWRMEVDGEWALSSYDPRVNRVEYTPKRGTTPVKHDVNLTVTDAKGNRKSFSGSYLW